MTTAYESDEELVARNVARIERVQQTLLDLKKKWASIDVHMESDDGDVQLSVNHQGRLMSLSLAPGCTTRLHQRGPGAPDQHNVAGRGRRRLRRARRDREERRGGGTECRTTARRAPMMDQPCSLPAANRPVAVATCRRSALR